MKNTQRIKARLATLNHKGFTLVEVLIALLVLGILFVPVSNAFLQSVHVNQHLRQRVTAVREAQTALEVTLSLLKELHMSDEESEKDNDEKVNNEAINEATEEQIIQLLADFHTSDLMNDDTMVEIAPVHQDSPFFLVTATNTYAAREAAVSFTLTTLRLPGEAPWLAPTEYRVVTP